MKRARGTDRLWLAWIGLAALLILAAFTLRRFAPFYAYEAPFEDMPLIALVIGYTGAAMVFGFALPVLIRKTGRQAGRRTLILILLMGAVARLSQLHAPAVLEDDYNRYLWDGAVTAQGVSAFTHAPLDIAEGGTGDATLDALAEDGRHVLERVNHPEYRTIYPPVLQAVFAVSHTIAPFDLVGWRVVLFLFELGIAGMILAILHQLGRSSLWLALYWWNPLVIKEIANSAHMEPVLMLPVVLAGCLVLRSRPVRASVMLALAAGVKVWPLLVAGMVWRGLLGRWAVLFTCVAITAVITMLMVWPILAAGLDDSSGFVAFAKIWKASSAVILVAESAVGLLGIDPAQTPFAPRLLLGLVLLGALYVICVERATDGAGTFRQFSLAIMALYLLLPSQTPWYFIWVAPFLCIFPVRALILAGMLLPMHYLFFHFAFQGQEMLYRHGVVWLIWVPVWAVLAYDLIRSRGAWASMTKEAA